MSESVIPGLTDQAERVLRLVVREEMQAVVDDIFENEHRAPCKRVKNLENVTYGNGTIGLKVRVTSLEEQVGNLVWLARSALGAAIVAAIATIVQAVR